MPFINPVLFIIIHVNPHYSCVCICKYFYLIIFIYNHRISTCGAVMVIGGNVQGGENFESPNAHQMAEAEEAGAPLALSSSPM